MIRRPALRWPPAIADQKGEMKTMRLDERETTVGLGAVVAMLLCFCTPARAIANRGRVGSTAGC